MKDRGHKYITFIQNRGRTFTVVARRTMEPVGYIEWYKPWRKYVFGSEPDVVWDSECLEGVVEFLKRIPAEDTAALKEYEEAKLAAEPLPEDGDA